MGDRKDMLGAVIKTARLQAGISRKDFATRVQISVRHLMYIENGRERPSYDLLCRMIWALNINANHIFYPKVTHDQHKFDKAYTMLSMSSDRELDMLIPILEAILKP